MDFLITFLLWLVVPIVLATPIIVGCTLFYLWLNSKIMNAESYEVAALKAEVKELKDQVAKAEPRKGEGYRIGSGHPRESETMVSAEYGYEKHDILLARSNGRFVINLHSVKPFCLFDTHECSGRVEELPALAEALLQLHREVSGNKETDA